MNNLLANTTILVIDDDADMCELLRTILCHEGANVLTANTVEDALDLCRRTPPHLVVSDMRLGLSDGFAVIEAIREYNREYRGFTPAIALTGFVTSGDEQRALAAGFDAYVHKPFHASELISLITSLLRRSPDLAA